MYEYLICQKKWSIFFNVFHQTIDSFIKDIPRAGVYLATQLNPLGKERGTEPQYQRCILNIMEYKSDATKTLSFKVCQWLLYSR